MCGIVALCSEQRPIAPQILRDATQTLEHRGPDAQHQWIARHGQAGLGHSRLSIIDLKTGDQPIANEDESLHLVVNGEFYGFEAIRQELQGRGHAFRTHSDSEIALHLYEEYGTRCLHHLRGEFAFALWDEPNKTLFAARDRFGIKPLYYSVHDGLLVLASEVKALFAAGIPASWDHENLYHALSYVFPPGSTLYAGIREVPPGHYLLANNGRIQILPYWDFDYPVANQTTASLQESIECLRDILHEAVRIRLRADVPVACYLSGGLDSCAVLGIASQYSSRPLQAFTLSFDEAAYDERTIAEEMAAKAGAEFYPIEIRAEHLAANFADAIVHTERPVINAHVVAKYLLSRAVRNAGVKVVLTGEGSDEIFAGYAHFRRDMLLYNRQGQQEEEIAPLLEELASGNQVSQGLLLPAEGGPMLPALRKMHSILGFVPSIFELWAQSQAGNDLLHPDYRATFETRNSFQMLLNQIDVERQLAAREPVHQSLYLWSKTMLNSYILSNLGDRMEMAHSVEGRLPFLDHKLVEAVVKMPVAHKISGMTEKYVLREAARPVLTETVYRRQKHPFLSPPSTLQLDGALNKLMQDTLRGSTLANLGMFDQAKVVALLDTLPTLSVPDRLKMEPLLMQMLSLCILQERFHLT